MLKVTVSQNSFNLLIAATGQQILSLKRMPLKCLNHVGVRRQGGGHFGRVKVPDEDRFVDRTAGQDVFCIGIPSQGQNGVFVAVRLHLFLFLGLLTQTELGLQTVDDVQVPDVDDRTHGADGNQVAAGSLLRTSLHAHPFQGHGKRRQQDVVVNVEGVFDVVVDVDLEDGGVSFDVSDQDQVVRGFDVEVVDVTGVIVLVRFAQVRIVARIGKLDQMTDAQPSIPFEIL